MYLVSRTASFAKFFFLLSLCGLIMYIVLAFYTFHIALTTIKKIDRTQEKIKNYPFPEIIKHEFVSNNMKHVLLWTIPNFKYNLTAEGRKIFIDNDCEHLNCYITTNKSFLSGDVKKFDAIVFSITSLRRWKKYLPKERSPKQKYIFYSSISANDYPICNIKADDFFNWTWTYKLHSDIPSPFIEVKDLKGNFIAPCLDVEWFSDLEHSSNSSNTKIKSKAILWINEYCNHGQSNVFAKELQKHLKEHSLELDVYGCGAVCPRGGCLKAIENDYAFYLAFEYSLTDDYVTKEVLKGYNNKAVPVVVGGADYSKFLPPGSYIDASYESPDRLAGLLGHIFRNPSTYHKYFSWKNHYTIKEANPQQGYCRLCALLNDKQRMETHSSYESFRKWWYNGNLREKCFPKGAESMDDVLSYIDNPELRKNYMP